MDTLPKTLLPSRFSPASPAERLSPGYIGQLTPSVSRDRADDIYEDSTVDGRLVASSALRQSIAENNLLSIVVPAGMGELIDIPQLVAGMGRRCYVAVPSKHLASSLHNYATSFGKELSAIQYTTTGHMLNILLGEVKDALFTQQFTIVLLHQDGGTIENYTILTLWRELYTRRTPVKIIVVSHVRLVFPFEHQPEIYHLRTGAPSSLVTYASRTYHPGEAALFTDTATAVSRFVDLHYNKRYGDILVFAPGPSEVMKIARLLQKDTQRIKVFALSGSVSGPAISYLCTPYPRQIGDKIRVIVICEYLEPIVTLPSFLAVVDTMYQYRLLTNLGGPRNVLSLLSQDAAEAHRQRTIGNCHRMTTEAEYFARPVKTTLSVRENPLYKALLAIWSVQHLEPPLLLKSSRQTCAEQWAMLRELNFVGVETLSPLGYFYRRVPLSLRHTSFLWQWLNEGREVYSGVVIASLLDCYDLTFYTGAFLSKQAGYTDLHTLLALWQGLVQHSGKKQGKEFSPPYQVVEKFARQVGVNPVKLQEVVSCVRRCLAGLGEMYAYQVGKVETAVIDQARVVLQDFYHTYTLQNGEYLREDGRQCKVFEKVQANFLRVHSQRILGLDVKGIIYFCMDPLGTPRMMDDK